ncbi:MAG: hypothetical protein WAT96_09000, partial [Streptococcus suis]
RFTNTFSLFGPVPSCQSGQIERIDLMEKGVGVGKNSTNKKEFRIPTPAQLKLSGRQFEVGNGANFVRNSRNG